MFIPVLEVKPAVKVLLLSYNIQPKFLNDPMVKFSLPLGFWFFEMRSYCEPVCPGTPYLIQTGIELLEIILPRVIPAG